MMNKGVAGLVVGMIAVLAFMISGCGGGGSSEPLSKAEFKKQANQICLEAEKRRSIAVTKLLQGSNSQRDAENLVIKLMPTYEQAAEQIGELGAPEGDEEKIEAIVKSMEEAAAKAKADPGTAVAGNLQFREADELAEKYGLKNCRI